MTIPLPDMTNMPPYVPGYSPTPNITPFTYRDGMTYLQRLERIATYINQVIVPFVNENYAGLAEAFEEEVNRLIQEVNAALEANNQELDQKILEMEAYVADIVAGIENDSIEANDPVVEALVKNPASLTSVALAELYASLIAFNDLVEIINTGRLSVTELDATYASKATQETVETGRLTVANLDAAYAQQSIEDIVNTGRLTVASLDATYAQQSVEDTVTTGRLSPENITASIGPALRGETARKFKFIACALRNDGTGWKMIDDTGHKASNIDTITETSSVIAINYPTIAATKVVGFSVSPDESFAGVFEFGASVGLANAYITIRRHAHHVDYIQYNGAEWVSARGLYTVASFASGIVKLTSVADAFSQPLAGGDSLDVAITGRGGVNATYQYAVGSAGYGSTSLDVEIRNMAGVLVAAADSNMRFVVSRGTYVKTEKPSDVSTAPGAPLSVPGGNIWVIGVFETTA